MPHAQTSHVCATRAPIALQCSAAESRTTAAGRVTLCEVEPRRLLLRRGDGRGRGGEEKTTTEPWLDERLPATVATAWIDQRAVQDQGEAAAAGKARVVLVPWDATDDGQAKRLYEQRVACSWAWDEVASWRVMMLRGDKVVYWVTLADGSPGGEAMLAAHRAHFPKEREPLVDAATRAAFLPVGHVALEALAGRNARFGLPAGTYWAKSLYVSRALHSSGIGRAAMAELELIAARPPFSQPVLPLDTIQGAFERAHAPRPGPPPGRTNEAWFLRQGYRVMGHQDDLYRRPWSRPEAGEWVSAPAVFMKKNLP